MTKRFTPSGVMPALVTPFTRHGDIHEEGLKEVIDYTIEKGCTGVVPAGTTGEFVYMRTEERKKLLKLTVEHVDGRVPVVAGTGQNSTRATISLTKYAADLGCDAALVVSPFFLRPDDKGYYQHYADVAREGNLPVILYNIPQCTLGTLQSNVVQDLADLDNIVGIKDSGGDIGHTMELIQKVSDRIPVLIGHDECFLSAVSAGASAAIMASANIMPHIWLEIMECVQNGNFEKARKMQLDAQTLARIVTRNGGAPPVKAALKMMGIEAGYSRMPLDSGGTLTRELKEEIRLELEKLGLIETPTRSPLQEKPDVRKLATDLGFENPDFEGCRFATAANDTVSVTVVTGKKKSAIGDFFVRLLTTPKQGYEGLTVILEPNLAVKPSSLMVPARGIQSMRQASLFYGPVQSGAAKAIAATVESGAISEERIDDTLMILMLDVNLDSRDRRKIVTATEEVVAEAMSSIWS
ncbi:MAG: 4-hydroxy-tetrahydrodipicolinate synthase [Candidatus Thorarchaeota archaeon]